MSLHSQFITFVSGLALYTMDDDPVKKIEVSPKLFDQLLHEVHRTADWIDNGRYILSMEIAGVQIVKGIK